MFRFALRLGAALALAAPAFAADRMNPDISLNALLLWQERLSVQEVELQLLSDIDPYLRGDVMLSISQDPLGAWGIEPEEAYIESLGLPLVTIKAGKFKAALGKQNTLHTHAYPFIDAPLPSLALLGPEGLDDPGASASLLIPAPFFLELTAQAFNSDNPILFNSPWPGDVAGLGSLKLLLDLGEDTTFELIGSAISGRNATDDISWAGAGEFSLKWRHNENHALVVSGQLLQREIAGPGVLDAQNGASAWLQWQLAKRWWLQGRAEMLGLGGASYPSVRKYSALLALVPTEFSGLRAQYDWIESKVGQPEHKLSLQLNVTMGVHPAHSY